MKRILLLACAACASSAFGLDPGALSGSLSSKTVYIGYSDSVPSGSLADWMSVFGADFRISDFSARGGYFASVATEWDAPRQGRAPGGTWKVAVREAWGGIWPADWFSAKLGRFSVAYGTCTAFNPANPLAGDELFSIGSPQTGVDGISAEFLPLASFDSLWSLTFDGSLLFPVASGGLEGSSELKDSAVLAKCVLVVPEVGFLGITELGASCFSPESGFSSDSEDMAAGFWAGTDILGFVLGGELQLTEDSYEWAASINRRQGDFLLLAECQYSEARDAWLSLGRLSRSDENTEAGISCLWDSNTESVRTLAEFAFNATDSLVAGASFSWNQKPEEWAPPVSAEYAAELKIEYFF